MISFSLFKITSSLRGFSHYICRSCESCTAQRGFFKSGSSSVRRSYICQRRWGMLCYNVKQCSNGDPAIKVMKMDGQILKYEGPMYAEEILCNYPNDAIFHSDSFHRFGGRCRALEGNTELRAGELYYLIPHPPARSREFYESSSSEIQNQTRHKRCLPRSLSGFRDKKPSIEIIPSPSQDGVVKLKLLISKKELATLMSESTDAMTMVESIVTPLLTEMEAGNPPKASSFSSSTVARGGSGGYSWKPELESIPEINVTLSS